MSTNAASDPLSCPRLPHHHPPWAGPPLGTRLPSALPTSRPAAGLQGTRQEAVKRKVDGAVGDHSCGGFHLGCYGSCSRAHPAETPAPHPAPLSPRFPREPPAPPPAVLSFTFFSHVSASASSAFQIRHTQNVPRAGPFVRPIQYFGARGHFRVGWVISKAFSTATTPPLFFFAPSRVGFSLGRAKSGRGPLDADADGDTGRSQRSVPPELPHPQVVSRRRLPHSAQLPPPPPPRAGPVPDLSRHSPGKQARERLVNGARGEARGPGESRAFSGLSDCDAAAAGARPGVLRGGLPRGPPGALQGPYVGPPPCAASRRG